MGCYRTQKIVLLHLETKAYNFIESFVRVSIPIASQFHGTLQKHMSIVNATSLQGVACLYSSVEFCHEENFCLNIEYFQYTPLIGFTI